MKKYIDPSIELNAISARDVITASDETPVRVVGDKTVDDIFS